MRRRVLHPAPVTTLSTTTTHVGQPYPQKISNPHQPQQFGGPQSASTDVLLTKEVIYFKRN